jgi:hypothetical protein
VSSLPSGEHEAVDGVLSERAVGADGESPATFSVDDAERRSGRGGWLPGVLALAATAAGLLLVAAGAIGVALLVTRSEPPLVAPALDVTGSIVVEEPPPALAPPVETPAPALAPPADPAPAPPPAGRPPARLFPAKPRGAEPPPEPPGALEPREVSRALFVMSDASSLDVRCGTVSGQGTNSVRLSAFPAGTCVVRADYLGTSLETAVPVDAPRTVQCVVRRGALTCT